MSVETIIEMLRRDGYLDAVALINRLKDEADRNTAKTVTEWCPHCESEIELVWDVGDRGYKAFCPVCGKRLMLCNECMHSGSDGEFVGKCDYSSTTDACQHNQVEDKV